MLANVLERQSIIQTNITSGKKGYSLDFLADQYCLSVAFLRKLVRQDRLKPTKIGSRVIILAEDWDNFLEKEKNK